MSLLCTQQEGALKDSGSEVELLFLDRMLAAIVLTAVLIAPLLFMPVMEDAFGLPKVTLLRIAAGASLALLTVRFIQSPPSRRTFPPFLSFLLVAFLVVNLLAFVRSMDFRQSLLGEYLQHQGITTVVLYFLFMYLGARLFRSLELVRILFLTIVMSSIVVAAYTFMQYLDLDPVLWEYGSWPPERMFSSLGQSNLLAAYLVMVIPLVSALFHGVSRLHKISLIFLFVLLVIALALSMSRAGYLAFLITIPLFIGSSLRRVMRWRTILLCILAVVAITILSVNMLPFDYFIPRVAERFIAIKDGNDKSAQSHLGMWIVAGKIALDYPVLGTGHETYPALFARYYSPNLPGSELRFVRPEDPHNHYLAVAASIGIPGLVLYLSIVGNWAKVILRGWSVATPGKQGVLLALLASIVAHLVTDLFTNADITSGWLFWLLIGAGIGIVSRPSDTHQVQYSRNSISQRLPLLYLKSTLYLLACSFALLGAGLVTILAVVPLWAEIVAGQAKALGLSQRWQDAALQYDRAVALNPFQSRYLIRASEAYVQTAIGGVDVISSINSAVERHQAFRQRFTPEAPILRSEANLRTMLQRLGASSPEPAAAQVSLMDGLRATASSTSAIVGRLRYPIAGACLPQRDDLLPNARRSYRAGIHEGIDFSPGLTCAPISEGTPVLAAAAGTVIRADGQFVELGREERDDLLLRSQLQGATDAEALDRFRGRQVWIDHGGGIGTRYAHLERIAVGVETGTVVPAGRVIGYVGNSGMPESMTAPTVGYHLHFEIRVHDSYLGAELLPEQMHSVLQQAFLEPNMPRSSLSSAEPDPLEALIEGMSLPDKVGQLMLLGFTGAEAAWAVPSISELRAGGIVLLNNVASTQDAHRLTTTLQQIAHDEGVLPLLITINYEGGAVQPLIEGVTPQGANWQLGQMDSEREALRAACQRGALHGRELVAAGIHMNLAPVLDIWDNPQNTVIGERSYSSSPELVARLGSVYITALQSQGVLAVAKHFPGHGSTAEDSHVTLPTVDHDRAWLETHELVPFRTAVQTGVSAVMMAHVSYPRLDPMPGRPASLSPIIATELLRRDLGYQGLVMTDDLGMMRAVTDRYEAGEAAIKALQAGVDMLLVIGPLEHQRRIVEALTAEVGKSISLDRLNGSVRRVLQAKQQAGVLQGTERFGFVPVQRPCEG